HSLDDFMLSVLDHYSIHVDELAPRTYRLGSAGVFADSFPGLPSEGISVTCDRQRALSREDIQFLTWDHPLVTGALDLLLGSEKGNSSLAHWSNAKTAGFYVETVYVLECIAPPHFHADRFLPPTPLRIVVDHLGNDAGISIKTQLLSQLDKPEIPEDVIPSLLEKAHVIAQSKVVAIVKEARKEMNAQLEHEIARLKE